MDCLFLEHARGFIILNDYYKAMGREAELSSRFC